MKQIVDRLLVRYMHRCILCIIVSTPMSLWAQTTGEMSTTDRLNELSVGLNTVWMLLAAMLVFFMQPGFALVEAGFTRMKNTANPTSTFPPQNFPVIQHLQFLHIYCGYYKFSNSTELG